MKFEDVIKKRYSCRRFQDKPVETALLEEIMEDGRISPSACNSQRWAFIGVNEPEKLKKISEALSDAETNVNTFTSGVPAFIVVVENPLSEVPPSLKPILGEDGRKWLDIDLGVAASQMALSATSRGLGNTIVGHYMDEQKIIDTLGLKGDMKPVLFIALGYEQKENTREPRRKDADDVIFMNMYKD